MSNPWRQDFPQIKPGRIYLDSAAMSLKPRSVIEAVEGYYSDFSVNVHRSLYQESIEATNLYEGARTKVAAFINAFPEEIVFTRGATAALNFVAMAYGMQNLKEGDEIITSELEHHSSILPWREVAKKTGAKIKYLPLTETGKITVLNFKKVLSDKTRVVALTHASNVLGYLTPIAEIISLAHQKKAITVIDCAQSVSSERIDVKKLDVDFLAFSGHKMLAPTGIGVLFGKKGLLNNLEPIEFGGDMNDFVTIEGATWKDSPYRFEAGTMPIASAIGLRAAIEYLELAGLDKIDQHLKDLYHYAIAGLKNIPGVKIYNPEADKGIITFNLEGVPAHDAVSYYAEMGIMIRSGHHCAQLVSAFFGIDSSLRASFHLYTTKEDIDRFLEVSQAAVDFFRNLGF